MNADAERNTEMTDRNPRSRIATVGNASRRIRQAPPPSHARLHFLPDAPLDRLAGFIVVSATLMNFVLAMVNANAFGVSNAIVIATQVVITAIAALLALYRFRSFEMPFIFSGLLLLLMFFLVSLFWGWDPKSLYDILIIPIFIALGASLRSFPNKAIQRLFWIVFSVTLLELLLPSVYTFICEPAAYFNATRAWFAEFASTLQDESPYYAGANRAGGMIFAFADHRLGSIFLEPVSLGYAALIFSFYFSVRYLHYPLKRAGFYLLCLLIALLADSRIPAILIVITGLFSFVLPRPPRAAMLAAPASVFVLALLVYWAGNEIGFEDTLLRVSVNFEPLRSVRLSELLLGRTNAIDFGDSGFLYLVDAVGLIGLPVVFLMSSGNLNRYPPDMHLLPTLAGIYLATGLLFGGAVLSIKTAAVLGLILGGASSGYLRPLDRVAMPFRVGRTSKPQVMTPAQRRAAYAALYVAPGLGQGRR